MAIPYKYKKIVEDCTCGAAAAGVPGALLPGLDIASISGIWTGMIISIAQASGNNYSTEVVVKKFVSSVLNGISLYVAGSSTFTFLLHFIPGVGTLAAMGINAFLNALFTYRFGSYAANAFDRDKFDMEDVSGLTQQVLTSVLFVPSLSEIRDIFNVIRS